MNNRICPKCDPKCEREYNAVRFCPTCGIRLQTEQEIRQDRAVIARLLRKHEVKGEGHAQA